MLCFFALSIANAEGLSVTRIAISAFRLLLLIASMIDWKFEPLPDARTPTLKTEMGTSSFTALFQYGPFPLIP